MTKTWTEFEMPERHEDVRKRINLQRYPKGKYADGSVEDPPTAMAVEGLERPAWKTLVVFCGGGGSALGLRQGNEAVEVWGVYKHPHPIHGRCGPSL